MEKPCRQSTPNISSRNGTKTSSGAAPEMAIGNGTSTVIDLDDHHQDHGSLLNGDLPNGLRPDSMVPQANGAMPYSAVQKIAIQIAEASAAHAPPPRLEPEPLKTILSVAYCMFVSYLSAFTMTYTHDRTPDLTVNPPLPDVVFELVPRVEWAFLACEICMMFLVAVNVINLTFHKHRLIVIRRCLVIVGFALTMRCLTMLVTSLSLTGYHVHCGKKMYDSVWSKLGRATSVAIGLGMTVTGVRDEMCGDYMYSGHTVSIMATCLFFTESILGVPDLLKEHVKNILLLEDNTPSRCRLLHFLVWLTAGASLFFIVAAHEHYTVDVVVAVIITTLLFLYYHTLANTRAHLHRDLYKVRVWFPFFYYLESKVDGVVPNEYEWPFQLPSLSWPRCPKLWHRSKSGLVD